MTSRSKHLARRDHQPSGPDAPPEPWSQRDANIVHGIDLGWRLLLGFIAGLLGLVFIAITLSAIHGVVSKPRLPDGMQVVGLIGAIVLGALFLSFAAGQVMRLSWIGGDQGFDERLWARMTTRERGLWQLRGHGSAIWTFRIWTGVSLALLLYLDVRLWGLLRQAADGRWQEPTAAAGATVVMGYLAYRAFAARYVPAHETAPAAVSQGRWVLKAGWPTRAGALFFLLLALGFLAHAAIAWLADPTDYIGPATSGVIGLFFLHGATTEFRDALRSRRLGRPELEVVRKLDRPLLLACAVTLPATARDATRFAWTASFEAYSGRNGSRSRYSRWLEAHAAVRVTPGTNTGHFTLSIDMPETVPYPHSAWVIRIQSDERGAETIEFLLPQDLVFTEDYPAG